jgi:hypothetical protein
MYRCSGPDACNIDALMVGNLAGIVLIAMRPRRCVTEPSLEESGSFKATPLMSRCNQNCSLCIGTKGEKKYRFKTF